MTKTQSTALLAPLVLMACDEQEPQKPTQTQAPVVFVVPAEVSANTWRYSNWFNDTLQKGMSLQKTEELLGKEYSREEEGDSFTIDYVYDDGNPNPPKGAVVGITLYFEGDVLDGWICSVHRELVEQP